MGTDAWTTYKSAPDAARILLVNRGHVSKSCNKGRKTVNGYEFEFADPTELDTLEGEEWKDVLVGDL